MTLKSTSSVVATLVALLAAPALGDDLVFGLDSGGAFVLEDNTATIERLRVDEATGDISRNGALFVHVIAALEGRVERLEAGASGEVPR